MKNRLTNQVSETASVLASTGLSLGVLGLTASLMLVGCSDRHRDPGNVVTPTATNVQTDSAVAESTDQLPAGMPATSIDSSATGTGSTSGTTTGADADAANSAATSTTQTQKTTTHKTHKHHMNRTAAKHKASKNTDSAPAATETAPATGGSDSGSTSSANSDMTSVSRPNPFLDAPGRAASALTDQGVNLRINDAAAASTL